MIPMTTDFMTERDWITVEATGFFNRKEAWGDPFRVKRDLIQALLSLRRFVGRKICIHNARDLTGHSGSSFHYTGDAADFHIEGMHVVDQFLAITRIDAFNGVGIYPHWNAPGLHGDIRPKSKAMDPDARWGCTAARVYVPITKDFLQAIQ